MSLCDDLATEAMRQLLDAMKALGDDPPLADRLKLVNESSRLLERIESRDSIVRRLGDTQTQGAA
jgi:hypothetical protein